MASKTSIGRKSYPDFDVNFYDEDFTFKSFLALSGALLEKTSGTGISDLIKQMRAAASDKELFEKTVVPAEYGDIVELYKAWNEFSQESLPKKVAE